MNTAILRVQCELCLYSISLLLWMMYHFYLFTRTITHTPHTPTAHHTHTRTNRTPYSHAPPYTRARTPDHKHTLTHTNLHTYGVCFFTIRCRIFTLSHLHSHTPALTHTYIHIDINTYITHTPSYIGVCEHVGECVRVCISISLCVNMWIVCVY